MFNIQSMTLQRKGDQLHPQAGRLCAMLSYEHPGRRKPWALQVVQHHGKKYPQCSSRTGHLPADCRTVLHLRQPGHRSSTRLKRWQSSSKALDIYNLQSTAPPHCSAAMVPSVPGQVVLGGVWSKRVCVLIVWVLAAVVCSRLSCERYAGIVIRVYGLAEVDGVLQLLLQHLLAGVPGQLEQKEARVGLRKEVVWRVVFI